MPLSPSRAVHFHRRGNVCPKKKKKKKKEIPSVRLLSGKNDIKNKQSKQLSSLSESVPYKLLKTTLADKATNVSICKLLIVIVKKK